MEDAATLYARVQGTGQFIETVKGRKFHIDQPTFDIEEIAHALSMQCRFTGHVKAFYSVAEHSCLVAHIMKARNLGNPFEGLMHDATEAYMSDMAAPWKALMPEYKRLETALEAKLRAQYGLPLTITDGCKRADWLALFVEAQHLLPSGGADWTAPFGVKGEAQRLNLVPQCWTPARAAIEFLGHFGVLEHAADGPEGA